MDAPLQVPARVEKVTTKLHNSGLLGLLMLLQTHWLVPGRRLDFKRSAVAEIQAQTHNDPVRKALNLMIEPQASVDVGLEFARALGSTH